MVSKKIGSFFLVISIVAVFLFGSVAFAQPGGGGAAPNGAPAGAAPAGGGSNPDIVGQWDKDKDGKVSKAEWPRSEALFKKLDKNNNGFVDADEKPQMPTSELMDANGDGKVSKDEFVGPADFFKQLDKDGDGFITDADKSTQGGAGATGGVPQK